MPDLKGPLDGWKDPDYNGAKTKKTHLRFRSYYFFFRSNLKKRKFVSPRSEKKCPRSKKKVFTPRPSLSRPVHLKYPPEPVELVGY
jgi:hypothetical protein